MSQQLEEPEGFFQSIHQPNDRDRTTIPNSGMLSGRNGRDRLTETDLGPNRPDRTPRLHSRHWLRKSDLRGTSDHATRLQYCCSLPGLSILKVAHIHSKADQVHRLYDMRGHSSCEVAIQSTCVEARFTPGLGYAHAGDG